MTDEPRNPDLRAEALAELRRLMDEAAHRGDRETHCAALATADADGRPSVRTVNIARVTPGGLLILVNAQTGKGRQMLANPRAALCFHWPALEQQAIVEGCVRMLSDAESDELWHIQPRENMLGHWASDQLSPAADSAAV